MANKGVIAAAIALALASWSAPAGAWERGGYRDTYRYDEYRPRPAYRTPSYGHDRFDTRSRYDGPPPWRRRWAHWRRPHYSHHWW